MPKPTEVGVSFPDKGLDVTCEYGRQPAATTPSAQNVRTDETITGRGRGGSRSGLAKYINDRVNGVSVVQHLSVLVDPQSGALNAEYEDIPGTIYDPSTSNAPDPGRNPGRFIRDGGSGIPPSRETPPQDPPADISFVQRKRDQPGFVNAGFTGSCVLDSQPVNGNLLVVVVRTQRDAPLTGFSEPTLVTNTTLLGYTQVGNSGYRADLLFNSGPGDTYHSITVWYKQATAGADDQTVIVTSGARAIHEIVVMEYADASSTSPVSNQTTNSTTTPTTTPTLGNLALNNTTGQVVVSAFAAPNASYTPDPDYTVRAGVAPGDPGNILVQDRVGLSGAGPEVADCTLSIARPYCAIGIALTK